MRKIIKKGLASIYTDVPTLRPGTIEAYALAFVSAEVATVVRLAIDPYVMGAEWLTFFPGKRGKTRGGTIIRFPRRRESDSLWGCRLPKISMAFQTPI